MKMGQISLTITSVRAERRDLKERLLSCGLCLLMAVALTEIPAAAWHLTDMTPLRFIAYVAAAAVIAAILLPDLSDKKTRLMLTATAVGLVILFIILTATGTLSLSMGRLMNQILESRYLRTGYYAVPYAAAGSGLLALSLMEMIIGGLCALLMKMKLRGAVLVLPALMVILGGIDILPVNGWYVVFGAACLLMMAAMTGISPKAVGMAAAGLIIVSLVLGLVMAPVSGLAKARQSLDKQVHKLTKENSVMAMPEGNLKDLKAFEPTDAPALLVDMDTWTGTYIRGFVGGTYKDSTWQSLSPEDLREEAATLYVLQRDAFFGSTQYGNLWNSSDLEATDLVYEDNRITVRPDGACRAFTYLPYGISDEAAPDLDPHAITTEGDAGRMSGVTGNLAPIEAAYLLLGTLADGSVQADEAYLTAEEHYRDYVYTHFLDVPEEVLTALSEAGLTGSTGISTTQARKEIREALKLFMTYDESAVTLNGSRDFLAYLCDVNPRGYSVHYASLATMMLRTYGIPARYVEGYVVTQDRAGRQAEGEAMVLTQKNSRAFVEFYLDGIGWLPFDPTPGYEAEIYYELPQGQGMADNTPGNTSLEELQEENEPENEQKTVNVQEEDDGSRRPVGLNLHEVLILSLLILLGCLVLYGIYIYQKRQYLRRRRLFMKEGEVRRATGYILADTCRLQEAAGQEIPAEQDRFMKELWFSRHAVSEEQRQNALQGLEKAEADWRTQLPLWKRIVHRFIKGDVY